eukprot:2321003-Lingulodinium_polyedra.AAC.1
MAAGGAPAWTSNPVAPAAQAAQVAAAAPPQQHPPLPHADQGGPRPMVSPTADLAQLGLDGAGGHDNGHGNGQAG